MLAAIFSPESMPAVIAAAFVGWAGAAFGWIKWWCELREKRRERKAKEKAEAELKEIRRRSTIDNPYLKLSDERFNGFRVPGPTPYQQLYIPASAPQCLCFYRQEVEKTLEAGALVYLVVKNIGGPAPEVVLNIGEQNARLITADSDDTQGLYTIAYPYTPAAHGNSQVIKIHFLTATGFRDTHQYETVHGKRVITRIDPN